MTRPPDIKLKRHYRKLSEKQTDELVSCVADLVVDFIKQGGGSPARTSSIDPETGRN